MIKDNDPKCPNCKTPKKVGIKFRDINKFNIYYCKLCQNGFTYPVPKNISVYYHSNYWTSPGAFGKTKNLIFHIFHIRRIGWIKKYLIKGKILEIGAGEGNFEKFLGGNYKVTGLEFPSAKIKNEKILKTDYLKWKTSRKFDAVIFWESLEHVAKPEEYLKKSFGLLKNNGFVFIEFPRFDCLESRIFKSHWFHLDVPRHLVHLTDNGITIILKRAGFKVLKKETVFAPEYTVWGFIESTLDVFHIKSTDHFKKTKFSIFFLILLPLIGISFLIEILLMVNDESPIGFVAARKINV
ncbi:hypothetical protein A3A60_00950 [Candidatus Curtissbacteria bacterium RIFCSPLOWO2_01_FULL_42_26]|uniref:Methyltransferase type 12 n=1 Tax=Candidatus Curtissbacteria bacterium RIFCSPLOWO2_01_FULL_42_26 TaxID=1797729 RepID=A0A1F5HY51_9BACT|nr:MAG: hypothetical protein A3A60_00950 [Candidatus Curtissbacteria bacterium RIFCSPLOWO2_01_FULL_42_26]